MTSDDECELEDIMLCSKLNLKLIIRNAQFWSLPAWHTSQSGPGPWLVPSEKVDFGSLEKADPTPKFTVWVQEPFLTNLKELISNIKIYFLKISAQKYPNKLFWVRNTQIRYFGLKFTHFCFFAKLCN